MPKYTHDVRLKAGDLWKDVTITVDISESPQHKLRLWIARNLIKFAAFILGCGIEIKNEQ